MRRPFLRGIALLGAAVLVATGCPQSDTIVVVKVNGTVTGIRQLKVRASIGNAMKAFNIPEPAAPVTLPTDFSIQLDPSKDGSLLITVDAVDEGGLVLATGSARFPLAVGKRNDVVIFLGDRSDGGVDGPGGDGGGGDGTTTDGGDGSVNGDGGDARDGAGGDGGGTDTRDGAPGSDARDGAPGSDARDGAADPRLDTPLDTPGGNGTPCTAGANCASGFCVNGVCCESACNTLCRSCNMAATGQPSGLCLPVMPGTDPDNECAAQAASTCGRDGMCDGAGACRLHGTTVECAAQTCASGSMTPARQCDGMGVCAPGTPTQCAPYACGTNACNTSCTTNAECATGAFCMGGVCIGRFGLGQPCTAAADCLSNNCVEGVCCNTACGGLCQSCLMTKSGAANGTCTPIPTGMDPDNECTATAQTSCGDDGFCNGSGACRDWANTVVCVPAACTGGMRTPEQRCTGTGSCGTLPNQPCSPYVCDTNNLCRTTCTMDSHCDAASYCMNGTCVGTVPVGGPCSNAGQCTSGFCVDGFCCSTACTGICYSCSGVETGGANGTCAVVPAGQDPNADCPTDAASTCDRNGLCNGSGACQLYASGTVCSAESCSGTTHFPEESCNGTGTCVAQPSDNCGRYVCNTTTPTCRTTCTTNAHCSTGFYCNGSLCVPLQGQGVPCSSAAQCTSGFCIDGVCCENSCTGACQACSSAKTGGAAGACLPVANGTDPDAECPADAASTCDRDGFCDGNGACRLYGTSTVCAAGTCSGTTQFPQRNCNGVGGCAPQDPIDCGRYVCNTSPAECRTTCSSDAHCSTGNYCQGTNCVPKKGDGSSCAGANECSSSFCVDGFCCNTACNSVCQSCNNAHTLQPSGTCAPVTAGTDPANECSPEATSTCGRDGSCSGSGAACRLWVAGTGCAGPICAGGQQTSARTCNGTGTCDAGTTSPCGVYTCDATACRTTCSDQAHCTAGNFCDVGMGTCGGLKGNGQPCASMVECSSGICTEGVCCDVACGGLCESCLSAKSGGTQGTCASIPAGQDPDNECAPQAVSTCGRDGECNGNGVCRLHASGTQCIGPMCSGGSETGASTCNGSGVCNTPGSTPCTPYVCGASACKSAPCVDNNDCVAGAYCDPGLPAPGDETCQSDQGNGSACSDGSQCTSGICSDEGVCCDDACTATCKSCLASRTGGTNGICNNVTANGDSGGDCPDDGQASCDRNGKCNGGGGCQNYQGGVCEAQTCGGDPPVQTAAKSCNGSGDCSIGGGTMNCMPGYNCDVDACRVSCTLDAHCVDGYVCASGACKLADGESCGNGTECASTYCIASVCCGTACDGGCSAGTCSGGTCDPAPPLATCTDNLAYVCDGVSTDCPTMCDAELDCAGGHWCSNETLSNVCTPWIPSMNSCDEAFCVEAACDQCGPSGVACPGGSGSSCP